MSKKSSYSFFHLILNVKFNNIWGINIRRKKHGGKPASIDFCHGEHNKSSGDEYSFSLTDKGIDEVLTIKNLINTNIKNTLGFAASNKRSIQSLLLILGEFPNNISNYEYIKAGKVKCLPNLLYREMREGAFLDGLNKSIDERNVMRWTINLSDDDMKKVGYVQSSYTVMAQDVAKVLQHYAKVCTRKHTNNENLYRIFCGKEFIYTSFRVKLLEILYGNDRKNEYISRYENMLENKPEARIEIGKVEIKDNHGVIVFEIYDAYGKESFTKKHLEQIISETVI